VTAATERLRILRILVTERRIIERDIAANMHNPRRLLHLGTQRNTILKLQERITHDA
jgi:hypothetical protein